MNTSQIFAVSTDTEYQKLEENVERKVNSWLIIFDDAVRCSMFLMMGAS